MKQIQEYIDKATRLFKQGNIDEALVHYNSACQLALQNNDTSEEEFKKILLGQAGCYKQLGQWDGALQSFIIMLINNPYDELALRCLYHCFTELSKKFNHKEIEGFFKKAIINMDDESLNSFSLVLSNNKMYYPASWCCESIIDRGVNTRQGLLSLSGIKLQMDKYEEARILGQQAHEIAPSAESFSNLAYIYTELGEGKLSLEHIEQAIALNSEEYIYFHSKAVSLLALGKIDESIEARDTMLNLFYKKYSSPLDVHSQIFCENHRGLAFAYLVKRQYQDALEQFKKALEYSPHDPASLIGYGFLLLGVNDREALATFLRVLELKNNRGIDERFSYHVIQKGIGFSYLYLDEFERSISQTPPDKPVA